MPYHAPIITKTYTLCDLAHNCTTYLLYKYVCSVTMHRKNCRYAGKVTFIFEKSINSCTICRTRVSLFRILYISKDYCNKMYRLFAFIVCGHDTQVYYTMLHCIRTGGRPWLAMKQVESSKQVSAGQRGGGERGELVEERLTARGCLYPP